MHDRLIRLLTKSPLSFKLVPDDKARGAKSPLAPVGTGMLTVTRYSTPKGQQVDVVRSSIESPLLPLYYYWSSLLINYVTPTHCACGYPDLTIHRAGLIKGGLTVEKDKEAMKKYNERGFVFVDDGCWRVPGRGTQVDLDPWVFGDSSAMVGDYRKSPLDERPTMPVHRMPDSSSWYYYDSPVSLPIRSSPRY